MTRTIVAVIAAALAVAGPLGIAQAVDVAPVDDRANLPGDCRAFVNDQDPTKYAIACVPVAGWKGGDIVTVWEDGSSLYSDGSVFDPEDMRYRWRH